MAEILRKRSLFVLIPLLSLIGGSILWVATDINAQPGGDAVNSIPEPDSRMGDENPTPLAAPCDRPTPSGKCWSCIHLTCCRSTKAHLTCSNGPDVDCRLIDNSNSSLCCDDQCSLPRIP